MAKGTIIRRGEHSWRIKFDLERDATGARKTHYSTFRGTKKEAQAELVRLLDSVNRGAYVDQSKVTVAEFLARWDNEWASLHLQPKTLERARQLIRLNVNPHIGNAPLQQVKPVRLQGLYATLLRKGGHKGGPLSARTVGQVHRFLHRAFGHAVTWGLLVNNPASSVEPPPIAATEIEVLTEEQAKQVQEALKGDWLRPIVVFALATGCRRGEIAGLCWRHVDFDKASVRIEQSLETTENGQQLRFKEPKTKHGRRNVTLPAYAVAELRAHWKAQQETRLAMGKGGAGPDDVVFSALEGGPLNPDVITWRWIRVVKSKKLPPVSFHALRHTHVSQLIASGLDVLTISRRIGHSSPTITLGVYGHLFSNTDAKAAAVLEAAYGKSSE